MTERAAGSVRFATWGLAASLMLVAGCPPRPSMDPEPQVRPVRSRSQQEIVGRIQENARRLDQALWSSNVQVVARFTDEDGESHPYNLEGSLLFQRPRNLLINLRPGIGDNVMQVGSNDAEYWAWIEPEISRMWWGRHEYADYPCAENILVNPSELVAAMGIDLPGPRSGLIGPIHKSGRSSDILEYVRKTPGGGYRIVQEYRVMRVPPFLVEIVVFYDAGGKRAMTAHLTDYRPAWESGPLLAHQISIDWPREGNKLNMAIATFKPVESDKLRAAAFARPTQSPPLPASVARHVVQVDAECDGLFDPARSTALDDGPAGAPPIGDDPAAETVDEPPVNNTSTFYPSPRRERERLSSQDVERTPWPEPDRHEERGRDQPSSYETGDYDWPDDESDPLPERS